MKKKLSRFIRVPRPPKDKMLFLVLYKDKYIECLEENLFDDHLEEIVGMAITKLRQSFINDWSRHLEQKIKAVEK